MTTHPIFGERLPIPTLGHAARDRSLSAGALRVLLFAWFDGALDLHEYRPVKKFAFSHVLGISEKAVGRALDELVAGRYIACGASDPLAPAEARGERPRWYRLAYGVPRA